MRPVRGLYTPVLSVIHIKVDLKLSQPERHRCKESLIQKQAKSIVGTYAYLSMGHDPDSIVM